jgi:hypothetical protein
MVKTEKPGDNLFEREGHEISQRPNSNLECAV